MRAFIDRIWNLLTWTPGAGAPRQLTHFPTGSIYNTAWSPDGKTVYFGQGHSTQDAVLIRGFK
jgi:Tol biopolymer transport system component